MNKSETDELDVGIIPARAIVNGEKITEENFLHAVDEVVQNLYQENDISIVDNVIDTLLTVQHFSGRSLAKLLWNTKQWWIETKQDIKKNDTFQDYMEAQHGIKPIQLERYTLVWQYTESHLLPKAITQRPMKDQIAISKLLEDGFEPSKENWKKLEQATGNSAVLEILRKIKKKKPKKGSLQIYLERDGSLQAWYKEKKYFVGYLNIKAKEDEDQEFVEVVEKAISRIINNAGVIKK